jgi:hypothetical protein
LSPSILAEKNMMSQDVLLAVNSPLTLFALAILICNMVFTVCATRLNDTVLFKYCIHMFLGIVLFVGSIVLWCPRCLYDATRAWTSDVPYNPWAPTFISLVGFVIYVAYHGWKHYPIWLVSLKESKEVEGNASTAEGQSKE